MTDHIQTEFERLWRDVHAGATATPSPPMVDFAREVVIVASMGFQASVGSNTRSTAVFQDRFMRRGAEAAAVATVLLSAILARAAPTSAGPSLSSPGGSMPRLYPLLLAPLLVASTAAAQDAFHNEIGIMVGLTVLGDSSAITSVGVPGAGGALGPGALYAARVQRPWIFESHFSLNHFSGGGMKFTQVYVALQADYLLSRTVGDGPYVFANIGNIRLSGDLDARENLAGGGLGYRVRLEERLAVRLEARLRRWLDSDLNEYGLFVGAGVRL